MSTNKSHRFRNLHLNVSVILIILIAVAYGFFPGKIIPVLNNIQTDSNDLKNAFKAVMGLYLAMAMFWSFAVINPKYWNAATLSNIFFMLGLALGRIASLAIDGLPDKSMLIGIGLELFLGIWGIISLTRYRSNE